MRPHLLNVVYHLIGFEPERYPMLLLMSGITMGVMLAGVVLCLIPGSASCPRCGWPSPPRSPSSCHTCSA